MTNTTEELLPCRKCGGTNPEIDIDSSVYIQCRNCSNEEELQIYAALEDLGLEWTDKEFCDKANGYKYTQKAIDITIGEVKKEWNMRYAVDGWSTDFNKAPLLKNPVGETGCREYSEYVLLYPDPFGDIRTGYVRWDKDGVRHPSIESATHWHALPDKPKKEEKE
jgi:hypothetical protein